MQDLTQANEKYCGDLVQKKTYTPDYLSHEKKVNLGQEEYVVLRDHHEPIISRETFEKAQKELERRCPSKEKRAKHSSRYCLSGKIQCGCCGSRFVSRVKKRKDKSLYKAWRCYEAARHGLPKTDKAGNQIGCAVNRQICDEDFMWMIQMVIRHLQHNKERLISDLAEIVRSVLSDSEGGDTDIGKLEQKLERIAEKRERLLDLYLGQEISKDDCRRTFKRYDEALENLKRKIKEAEKQKEISAGPKETMTDITAQIRALASGEKQDDTFYRNMVEKVVVRDREHIDIYLNLLPYKWSYVQENEREQERHMEQGCFLEETGTRC